MSLSETEFTAITDKIPRASRRPKARQWETITEEEKQIVKYNYVQWGMPLTEAGLQVNVRSAFVKRILKEAGIPIRRPGQMTEFTKARKRAERGMG